MLLNIPTEEFLESELDTRSFFTNVLLIEDDESHAKLITRILQKLVGEIRRVSTGEEALRALEESLPELVLADLQLPDMSGVELLRTVRNVRPHLPVVVMTSSSNLEDAVTAMREGAWDYMVKQFSEDLRERFQIVIRRTAARQLQQVRELKLRAERDAFWAAVRAAQDGLGILDDSGGVVFSNEAFDQFLLLVAKGNLQTKNVPQLLAEIDRGVGEGVMLQLAERRGDSLWRSELRVAPKTGEQAKEHTDGNARYFELTLTRVQLGGASQQAPFSVDAFRLRRYVLWVHDITNKKAQERFQRDLLSTTSHDLKGPLGAIVTSAELLSERSNFDESKKQELITRIASCARSAISLIDELLSARRIQDGLLVVKPRWYDVNDVLEDIVLDYFPLAKAKSISFGAKICPTGLKVFADKIGLHRVLGNLVSNAIKFTPNGGQVELSALHVDTELRISVRDTGPGIESEARHRLFQRFARLDKHQEVDGTGLGLFVTKNIVDAHNGRIELQSEMGAGTIFTVCFPDEIQAVAVSPSLATTSY